MDHTVPLLFGDIEDQTNQNTRKLNTKYLDRAPDYLEEVIAQFKKLNLFEAVRKLAKKAHCRGTWTKKMQK